MAELLKNAETVKLGNADTKKLGGNETKKLAQSATRSKKEKAKYNVKNAENSLLLKLKDGDVVIEMFEDDAPKHVARIKELVRSGYYDGLTFHRVIDGFMAQGGDPTGTGAGGSGVKLPAEFTNRYSHKRGVVSMARAQDPNSADSQFFIVLANSTYLDGQYTIWGYVIDGMEYVDKIAKGDIANNGIVAKPDKIVKMSVAADVEKAKLN